VSYDDQRCRYEQLKADRRVVEQAAAHLRQRAILDAYAGLEHKHLAFALARWTGARTHILHLSSSDALPMLASARRDGVAVTVETCPHYLTFTAEAVPDGATQYKCCPPIREEANRESLWQGLADGMIDIVVSDHSPSTPELKRLDTGDFGAAWGGISSLQLGLTAIWSQARARGHTLDDVVAWMASGPRRWRGCPARAGSRWGRTRTSVSSRRTRRVSSTRCGCSTATR